MSAAFPIPRQTRQAFLTASAGQTVFGPTDFLLFDPADVQVRAKADGATDYTVLASNDYTVSPAAPATSFPAFFTVTLNVGRAAGDTVWIKGARLGSRTTNVTRSGQVQSQPLESELDEHVIVLQELRRDIDALFSGGGTTLIASGIGNDSSVPGDTVADALEENAAQAAAALAAAQSAAVAGAGGLSQPGLTPTLTSGVPHTVSDVAAASQIFITPASSDWIRIFDGLADQLVQCSEIALTLDANAAHAGYHQSGKTFDLFVTDAVTAGTGPAWQSTSARGTGAGTTELEFFKGLWRNKNVITLRIGPNAGDTVVIAARKATYVGSFTATANGQASDTVLKRLLFSAYNSVPRQLFVSAEALGTTWHWTTMAFHVVNANVNNKVAILQGLQGGPLKARATSMCANSADGVLGFVGIGINSTSVNSAKGGLIPPVGINRVSTGEAHYWGYAPLGYTEVNWLEASQATGDMTWYAGDATLSLFTAGMQAEVWG